MDNLFVKGSSVSFHKVIVEQFWMLKWYNILEPIYSNAKLIKSDVYRLPTAHTKHDSSTKLGISIMFVIYVNKLDFFVIYLYLDDLDNCCSTHVPTFEQLNLNIACAKFFFK